MELLLYAMHFLLFFFCYIRIVELNFKTSYLQLLPLIIVFVICTSSHKKKKKNQTNKSLHLVVVKIFFAQISPINKQC